MKVSTSTQRINELFDSDPRNDSSIARALGVSRQSICSWRSGVRSPKKPILIKIAKSYNVNLDWLMGFDVDRAGRDVRSIVIPDSNMFKKLIMHMTPEDYKTMMDKKPEKVLELAVKGMLPKNALGRQMFRKLHVYAGAEHEQAAQKPVEYTFEQ